LLIGKNKPLKHTGFTIIFHTQVHPRWRSVLVLLFGSGSSLSRAGRKAPPSIL